MKGRILDYNEENRSGVISGDNGNRYNFTMDEWKATSLPRVGNKVDFVADGENANAIYVEKSILANSTSKKIVAALFAFFLGAFGAHKFYLGYNKQGVIMLALFLGGFILFGIPSMIIGIIAFIECILYITKSDEDFEQTYIIGKKPWF